MNQEEYLRQAIEDARGAFIVNYLDYHRGLEGLLENPPLYGSVLGSMRVYERLSRDESGELWQDAKDLLEHLVSRNSL